MIAIAFRRVLAKVLAGMRAVGIEHGSDDRGGQGKSRKVRPVGWGRKHQQIQIALQTLPISSKPWDFRQHAIIARLSTPFGADDGR